MLQEMSTAIAEAQTAKMNGKIDERTLIGSLLKQDLLPQEATLARLTQETNTVVGAGGETVARTLALASFHILDQPAIRSQLVKELTDAIPDPANMPDWNDLSTLPYLSACIEEAIRLTYGLWLVRVNQMSLADYETGVAERRSRAYDAGDLMYGEWKIPAGTFVGMSNYDVSHDENIFPDSFAFIPERVSRARRTP